METFSWCAQCAGWYEDEYDGRKVVRLPSVRLQCGGSHEPDVRARAHTRPLVLFPYVGVLYSCGSLSRNIMQVLEILYGFVR